MALAEESHAIRLAGEQAERARLLREEGEARRSEAEAFAAMEVACAAAKPLKPSPEPLSPYLGTRTPPRLHWRPSKA